ncbi:MAG: SH3 domain-containing protein [Lachnospiraceae bacterium]|nr:SH3 domain-containing protein [Lachnospiraceae bacterium]
MRKQNSIIRILIIVFAALIALLVIGGGIYLFSASKKLKSISLQPDFAETSLEVGTQYTFTIVTTPSKASIKKATCTVDDPTSSFEINDSGKAVLTTGMNEGNVTVYIECKGIKSQILTYSIVDSVARAQAEAAAQAEAQQKAEEEAAAAAEAEAAATLKKYVKSTGDDVNVRSTNSTDGDILGKAKKGDMFEKVEDVDDWTHILYKGQDGYMKTEFLTEISEEEYNEGPTEEPAEEKKDEKKDEKKEEKKTENTDNNTNNDNNTQATQTKEEAEAKAAADAAKAAEEAAKAAEEAAKAAAASQQTLSLSGVAVTPAEYKHLLDKFRFATPNGTDEEAKAEVEIHSGSEIITILQYDGYR